MIKIIREGKYTLTAVNETTTILNLDNKRKVTWTKISETEQILTKTKLKEKSHLPYKTGNFRVYEVRNEQRLSSGYHLEIHTGDGNWSGYLLPEGFPGGKKTTCMIVPVSETITKIYN